MQPLDCHVHIVGTGAGGTGCWMRLGGVRTLLQKFMIRHIGLSGDALEGDFDRLYVERLLAQVRASSLRAVCILAQDEVYNDDGSVREKFGNFYVPNDYVLELARRHPEFLPVVSVHPGRPDAIEELDRCIAGGAVMLKLLPNCQNVSCSDLRFTKFWEKMAEAGLPFLAHTGGEMTVPVANAKYADPRVLELPLQAGVKVIAAHCATRSAPWEPDYVGVLGEMMGRFPNLYADNSAFNSPNRSIGIARSLREPLLSRIVHGSDYPVPVLGWWSWLRGQIAWRDCVRSLEGPNVIERDCQLKRACGYTAETFTRLWKILRLPAGLSRDG
jgi:uncharacterized protein